ncbi:hypothetical protein ACSSS7_003554 [Eimeria intestinalis]
MDAGASAANSCTRAATQLMHRWGTIYPSFTTVDHKPTNPAEKKRIEAAGFGCPGGEVMRLDCDIPHRVFVKDHLFPGLAMSRAIGDGIAHQIGVVSEPEIVQVPLDSDSLFFIVASDGVWEFITSEEAVKIVSRYVTGGPEDAQRMKDAADRLAYEAFRRWIDEEGNVVDDQQQQQHSSSSNSSSNSGQRQPKKQQQPEQHEAKAKEAPAGVQIGRATGAATEAAAKAEEAAAKAAAAAAIPAAEAVAKAAAVVAKAAAAALWLLPSVALHSGAAVVFCVTPTCRSALILLNHHHPFLQLTLTHQPYAAAAAAAATAAATAAA